MFDASKANTNDPEISMWLASVRDRVGLRGLDPQPYWGLDDLRYEIGSKVKNCVYVVADTKVINGHEFFRYLRLVVLSDFSFEGFVKCIQDGGVLVDFDARTGHNHGTKFRIRQNRWFDLYSSIAEYDL